MATRELLDQLVGLGFSCTAVTASIFDPNHQVSIDEMVSQFNPSGTFRRDLPEDPSLVEISCNGMTHTILKTGRSQRSFLSPQEEEALLTLVGRKITDFHPDLLLTYGGLPAERKIHRLAHQREVPVVFYLHNGLYRNAETFSDVDLILVPSKFIADFYSQKLGIRSSVLHPFFKTDPYLANDRNPRFVTFINPVPEKGLTLFARIVAEALQQLPEAEFLVIEGRWAQADVARTGLKLDRIPNVKVIPRQGDMRTVYRETRILLHPSFGVEAFGRTIIEAQLNGIPVMAGRRGGIPEALNDGGFLFDIPDRCTKKYMAIPSPEEVQPWIETLQILLQDQEAYDEAQTRALRAAKDFSPEKIVRRAIDLFNELLDK